MISGPRLRRLFRLPEKGRSVEADVDAEIAYHLEQTERELRERGMSDDDARSEALRRFGDIERFRTSLGGIGRARARRRRRRDAWEGAWQDLARSVRSFRREPSLVAVVALTLALGIGVNATMFGVVDRLLLRPPPHVRDDGTLSRLFFQAESPSFGRVTYRSQSYPAFDHLRRARRPFDDIAATFDARMSMGRGASARRVVVLLVTPNLFSLVGVTPRAGRFFPPDEWVSASEPTAVVTETFATREFGSAEAAVGERLDVGKLSLRVIGVTPAGFAGVDSRKVDLFMTMAAGAAENIGAEWRTTPNMRWLTMVARRPPGIDPQQAGVAGTAAIQRYGREAKKGDSTITLIAGSVIPARQPDGSVQGRISVWLAGVSFLVLLVACANVANLLLARTLRRRRELAVHLALGIDRHRLSLALLAEGVMLAALAGALSLVAARWSGDLLRSTLLSEYGWEGSLVDGRLVAYTAIASLVAGVLAGLAPVAVTFRVPLLESLRAGVREGGGRRSALRSALIVVQGALTVVLLVGAGLFVQSFTRASTLDLGYRADRLIIASPQAGEVTRDSVEREALWEQFAAGVRALPGVVSADQSVTTPFESQWTAEVILPDRGELPPLKGGGPYVNAVTPGYFETMGMRLVKGRTFTAGDVAGSEQVVVINEAMARAAWPGADPIGRCFRTKDDAAKDDSPCLTIVGIVNDVRITTLGEAPPAHFFAPLTQWRPDMRVLFVRVDDATEPLVSAVRRALLEVAPALPYTRVRPFSEVVDVELRAWRLGATLFALFGALGLVVAAIGLYSVIAHDVTQRRREIGVRVALGARAGQVVSLVLRDGLRYGALGLAAGLLIAIPASARLSALLFQTSPHEPTIYLLAAGVLLAVAVLATLVPARRAVTVHPSEVLREE